MKKLGVPFYSLDLKTISENVFKLIDNDWMLITAGNPDHFNTMTASWGTLGILWNKPIAVCFIRPQRYTFEFAEKSDFYTLSFFEEKYRAALNFCGSKSGRKTDKIKETGLIPLFTDKNNVSFEQSRLIFECRKIYSDFIREENFIVKDIIQKNYPGKDFHKFYIGEIINCFVK